MTAPNLVETAEDDSAARVREVRDESEGITARQYFFRVYIARVVLGIILLGLWELASGNIIDVFWISSPSRIMMQLLEWLLRRDLFLDHISVTLQEMVLGYIIGSSLGIVTGLTLGRFVWLSEVLNPFIIAMYALPRIALAPLFILWFGIFMASKIALASIVVFFLVFFQTFAGVRDVGQSYIDVMRVMGASERMIFWKVILPASSTWILSGMRMAVPYALIGAIVGEIIGSSRGIGYRLMYYEELFDTTGVFSWLFVLMLMAIVLNELVTRFEGRILRWKRKPR